MNAEFEEKIDGKSTKILYVNTLYTCNRARNNMDAFWSSATVYQYMVKMLNAHRLLVYMRLWGFFSGSFFPDEIDFTFTLEFNSIANTELFNLDIY